MRSLRFVTLRFAAFGLAIGLVHCGGSDASFDSDGADTGDESSIDTGGSGGDGDLPDSTMDDTADDTGASSDSASDTGTLSDSGSADSTATDSTATDSGSTDSGSTDSGSTDSGSTDSGSTDSGSGDTMIADAGDAGCPTLVLGGATEDVYVDKAAAAGGNGTKACPFKTIAAATALAAPGAATTLRTIHVKGHPAAPDYVESGALVLQPKETLTSNYDTASDGAASSVRIIARGDCTAVSGTASFCAVGMFNDARLELVTVRTTTGSATGHAIATTNTLPASGSAAPAIVDVNAENANESGIRVYGSVTVGPRVSVTGNKNQGLSANRPTGATQAIVKIVDAPTLSGAPSNAFSSNTGNGIAVFGDYVITIEGATTASNGSNGIFIGTPYSATSTTSHNLSNIQSSGNNDGLRIVSGEVRLKTGAWTNRFDNNRNWGIESTLGDALGETRLLLDPKLDSVGTYLVGHEANGNALGGVHINHATPPATAAHSIASLQAQQNGSPGGALAYGIFVEVTGANQPSLVLRGSTLLRNTGAGLRYQKSATNTLDIGTAASGGFNVWGDALAASRNGKSAICYQNLTAISPAQSAENDRWSQVCPLPLAMTSFQNSVSNCGANGSYVEITYTGASAPISSVTTCY